MSSEKNESLFSPQSNAFKNILKKPKEEKKSFGKDEFLARRKFFLQKFENDGGIPKPKTLVNNSLSKKTTSNEKIKASIAIAKNINNTSTTKTHRHLKPANNTSTSSTSNIESFSLPPAHEWNINSAKSESLKKIITLAEKKDTNTVGKNVFNARQKFFADSQLNSVDQLMPRPCTPPGYVYFEKCPSPSLEPRRNSHNLYSSSPVLSPSFLPASPSLIPSSPSLLASSPTPSGTYSLPWEYGNSKKKELNSNNQHKKPTNVIESLEKLPLKSEIVLPDPAVIKKETITLEEPMIIQTEKVEALKPNVAKIIKILPKPVQIKTLSLPDDKPLEITTIKVEKIEPQIPKLIVIPEKLPEVVKYDIIPLPNDEPIELTTETIIVSKQYIPKKIYILPEPVNVTKEILPQDNPVEIITETVVAEDKQIPKIIKCTVEPQPEEKIILKDNVLKTMDVSSLALESNIEEKKENKKNNDGLLNNFYSSESQPLIDFDNEITSSSSSSSANENKPLLDLNDEIVDFSKQSKPLIDFGNDLFNNQPLIDLNNNITESTNYTNNITEDALISFDENPILIDVKEETNKKTNSIGSITELLINGTLSLDEPLPRKSIPQTPNSDIGGDLIEFSESEMSDKVKNWYNVVENAINNEERLDESLI